ncbi:MAG: 4'-phosphopantetheinyl transferase superfamily protein [Nitrospinae bacterium]|nr:4'-phosphopantetheinyl transferase superfamily protein [Nitrospinota bacterium]
MSQEGIQILFSRFDGEFDKGKWNEYMSLLPDREMERIERHTRWEGRMARLIGRLLLRDGLKILLGEETPHLNIIYKDRGKPSLAGNIDFNISHSGEYVICALSQRGRVGIDIEKIRDIEWEKFGRWIPPAQWLALNQSANPQDDFFTFWSINEAILKGDGQGLTALSDLHIGEDKKSATFRGEEWFTEEIPLAEGYRCHLACNRPNIPHTIKELSY